jgi:hypothetical protein
LSYRLRVIVLIALVAAALIPGASASAAPPTYVSYNLKNDYRDLACLAGRSGGSANLQVTTSQCVDSYTDQYWQLEPAPGTALGYYTLKNRISGLCLGMPPGATRNGDQARMGNCSPDTHNPFAYWALDATSLGDTFMLRHYLSQKCLVSLHTNGRATQFTCTPDYHDQWWHFVQRS